MGRTKLEGEDLNYFGIEGLRIAGGQGIIIIAVCQVGSRNDTAVDMYQNIVLVRLPTKYDNTSWADAILPILPGSVLSWGWQSWR